MFSKVEMGDVSAISFPMNSPFGSLTPALRRQLTIDGYIKAR